MIDLSQYEDGMRGLALGVFLCIATTLFVLCFFIGAWHLGLWVWSLA